MTASRTMLAIIMSIAILGICESVRASGMVPRPTPRQAAQDVTDRLPDPCTLRDVRCGTIHKAVVTAYSLHYLPMANGRRVHSGAAACPRSIPFGTRIIIAGTIYTCEDRMSRKYPERFDIWMPSTVQALQWGKRTEEVEILNK